VSNLWTAAGWRFQNTEFSGPVGIDTDLDGFNDLWGNGLLNHQYQEFVNNDADPEYDVQTSIGQEKSDFTEDDSYGFVLNNTYVLPGVGTVGLRISRRSDVVSTDLSTHTLGSGHDALVPVAPGDPTFSRDVVIHDINNDYDPQTWREGGAFETVITDAGMNFDGSFMTEWRGYEVRGDLGMGTVTDNRETSDSYNGEVVYHDPTIDDYINTYRESDTWDANMTEEGSGFFMGGSVRNTFQPGSERLNDGFWQVGVNMQTGGRDYVNTETQTFVSHQDYFDGDASGQDDFIMDVTRTEVMSDEGTADRFGFGVFGIYNRQLGDNVTFGFGAGWRSNSITRTTDYLIDFEEVETVDWDEDVVGEENYTQTTTETFAADRTWEQTMSTFDCPVGLEYRTGKRGQWAWRCGAHFTRTCVKTVDDLQAIDAQCLANHVDFNSADDALDWVATADNFYGSTRTEFHNTWSATDFTYGMGWMPTGNVQVDLLCIFDGSFDVLDSDFFKDLRLSITLNN